MIVAASQFSQNTVLPFATTYMCKTGFSIYILTKILILKSYKNMKYYITFK